MIRGVGNARLVVLASIAFILSFAVCAMPSPRRAPPSSARWWPQAEVRGGFVGRLKVAPEHGPVGTPVTVTGEGLPPGEDFDLAWSTVTGSWKVTTAEYFGRAFTPVAYRIAAVKTDAAGRFTATFAAPDDFGFLHDIVLQQGDRLLTQDAFNVDMTVKLLSERGPPGSPIEIEVHGYGYRELEDSWVLLYDNRYTGWMSAVTTAGSARVTIPATGGPGRHVLEVIHSDFTFPYRNKQQSPSPDRPQFKLVYTVTPGPAVLPPAPATQVQAHVERLPDPGELVAVPRFCGRRRAGGGERQRLPRRQAGRAEMVDAHRQPHDRPRLGGKRAGDRGSRCRMPRATSNSASRRPTISAAPTGLPPRPAA